MTSPLTASLNVLRVDASSRYDGSVTRSLTDSFINALLDSGQKLQVNRRDVAREGLPFIDEHWVNANFTPADQRTTHQQQVLGQSDALVEELQQADLLVIGAPLYNFSIPASLKAWIDLVARAGMTFRYTDKGPVGLLQDKKAHVILASGGTPIGSELDFASGYLRHVLGFIGIHDVTIITADRLSQEVDSVIANAELQIQQAVDKLRIAA